MVLAISKWVFYAFSVLIISTQVFAWFRTIRFFRSIPLQLAWQIGRFSSLSIQGFRLYAAVMGVISGAIILAIQPHYQIVLFPPPVLVLMISIFVVMLTSNSLPPAVLVLTSSHPRVAELLRAVNEVVWPMRAVALIDHLKISFYQRSLIVGNNLRTRNVRIWRSIVEQLIDMTPVIILDTRHPTEAVIEEARFLLTTEHASKAIFLEGPSHDSPVLEILGTGSGRDTLQVANEEEMPERLKRFIYDRRTFNQNTCQKNKKWVKEIVQENHDDVTRGLSMRCLRCDGLVPHVMFPCPNCGYAPSRNAAGRGCLISIAPFAVAGWLLGRAFGLRWLVFPTIVLGCCFGIIIGLQFFIWRMRRSGYIR